MKIVFLINCSEVSKVSEKKFTRKKKKTFTDIQIRLLELQVSSPILFLCSFPMQARFENKLIL